MPETPEEHVARLKQELADAKAEVKSLKGALDTRESDNKKARDRIKELEAEKTQIEERLPTEDAVILTSDEAKAWEAYRELGPAEQLAIKIGDYDRATSEAGALKRRALVDQAARDPNDETRYRFKPTVLERLLGTATLQRDEKAGTWSIKTDDTTKPLQEWLEKDQADFLPALKTTQAITAPRQAGDRREVPTTTHEQLVAKKRGTGHYQM